MSDILREAGWSDEMIEAARQYEQLRGDAMASMRGAVHDLYNAFGDLPFPGGGFFEQFRFELEAVEEDLCPRPPSKRGKRRISAAQRRRIFERDEYRCQGCGSWHDLTIDHIQPESRGGSDDDENLQTLCRPCNSRKGNRT